MIELLSIASPFRRLAGFAYPLRSEILNHLLRQVTYTFQDKYITFNKDLTVEPGISLLVGLILMDINTYDENTPLPLSDGSS